MKGRLPSLLLLLLLLSGWVWAAPGLEMETRLSQPQDPLPFGMRAELTVTLRWDEGWNFEPPEAGSLELPGMTVVDSFTTTALAPPGQRALEYHLVFTRFEAGDAEVGPVVFDTPVGPVKSEVLPLTFKGAEPREGDEPGQLRGTKPVVELSARDWWLRLAAWILGTLAVLALLGALIHRFGLLDRWLSPRRRALRELKQLRRALGEPPALTGEQAAVRLVEIVRDYLHRGYGVLTREATSSEILRHVASEPECRHLEEVVDGILDHGDGVKFARRQTTVETTQDLIHQFETLLDWERRNKK